MKTATAARRWIRRNFTLTEVLVVTAIVTSVPTGAYLRAKQKAHEIECLNNMRQVGAAIVAYHLGNGEYPSAAFYPENPRSDENSIRVVLADEIPGDRPWICPAMPDELKARGLTWVYNDTLAGKPSVRDPARTWILIEFTCVSAKVPSAHPGGFNIVYADGHVETSRALPEDITQNQQAMLWRLMAARHPAP